MRRDRDAFLEWARAVRNPLRVLISLTYDDDELLRWRAIEAAGWVATISGESELEPLRDAIRRLLWLMNDESGSLCRHAPELIGEILYNVPTLIGEYASLLLVYLREEPFERGVHFAIARVAAVDPEFLRDRISEIVRSLDDPDPMIRGWAALVLVAAGIPAQETNRERLWNDDGPMRIYDFDSGRLRNTIVSSVFASAGRRSEHSHRDIVNLGTPSDD